MKINDAQVMIYLQLFFMEITNIGYFEESQHLYIGKARLNLGQRPPYSIM